jgi:hypothetical protein
MIMSSGRDKLMEEPRQNPQSDPDNRHESAEQPSVPDTDATHPKAHRKRGRHTRGTHTGSMREPDEGQ